MSNAGSQDGTGPMGRSRRTWDCRRLIGAAWLALAGSLGAQDALVPRPDRAGFGEAPCDLGLPQHDAGSVVVLDHDGSDYSKLTQQGDVNWDPRVCLARRFYQQHGDNYDFLVVFTNFEFDTGAASAFHVTVRNNVQGIGIPPIDNGTSEGLPGRLKGYVDMAAISRWLHDPAHFRPGDPDFQLALHVLAHETAHQWLAQVKYRNAQGQDVGDLLGQDGAHWSYLLDSDASHMYGSDWVQQPDERYLAARIRERYSPLDLYLMGLLDPAQVPSSTLLRDPVPAHLATELPHEGDLIAATPETVSVDAVIAAEGVRTPDWLHSQKEFRLGFVFLAAPGTEPTPEQLAGVDALRDAFQGYFFAQTGGVAIADTVLAEQPTPPPVPAPDLQKAVDWLVAQQRADGSWQDSPTTAPRETALALEALARASAAPAAVARGQSWLAGQSWESVDFGARRAMGLALGSLDAPGRLALRQELLVPRQADGGFGAGAGYASDPLDTALALRALAALGQPADATVTSALTWLQGQHGAGGWPAVPGGAATSMATAEVLLAALEWRALPAGQALVSTALTDLLARQNADGGFGESPSTAYATALSLVALSRAQVPGTPTASATAWLRSHQLADGSWQASRYATALVLVALRGSIGANLTVPADSVHASPPTPDEGQIVTVTALVRSAGLAEVGPSHAALYDGTPPSGTLVQTVDVPALAAETNHPVQFEYDTNGNAGPHQLYVVADAPGEVEESREDDNAAAVGVTVHGPLPDLAFGLHPIDVQPDPLASGDVAQVVVTVENHGAREAPPSLLRLVLGDPQQGGQVVATGSLPVVAVDGSADVTLTWDTTGVSGQAHLVALADADYAVAEISEANNTASLDVRVDPAPPAEADLEAAWVRLDPSSFNSLPQAVAVSVRARNLGQTAATSTLALFDVNPPAGAPVAEQPISLAPRSAETVVFNYDVTGPGTRVLLAVLDRGDILTEPDETNNVASATLTDPANTVDLEILPADVVVVDPDLVAGETLEVTFTVRNRGTRPVTAVPVTLELPLPDGGELARVLVDVPAGGSLSRTLTWVTAQAADPLDVVLRADPFDLLEELREDNNQVPLTVHVLPSSLPDLAVTSADIAVVPDPPAEGGAAQVSVRVTNAGTVAAGPFVTRLYAGDPDDGGVLLGERASPGLPAGGEENVQVAWDPVGAQSGIVAVVDGDQQVAEYNEGNNRAFRPIGITRLPDLVLKPGAVWTDPPFPHVGEEVAVEVSVVNRGQRASTPALLRFVEIPAGVPQDLPLPAIEPGQAVVVPLTYGAGGTPGERRLQFAADAENAVAEQDEGNNAATLTLIVQDADLYLTAPFFSPNGDGVQDTTSLFWRAGGVARVAVKDRGGRRVRVLDNAAGTANVTWDGADELGGLSFDGAYELVLETADGTIRGSATAVLDTNRSPLHDAAGLGLTAETNLTCKLPDSAVEPFWHTWLPGEDGLLAIVKDDPPTGLAQLVRIDLKGNVEVLLEAAWLDEVEFNGGVSPDGREVLLRHGQALEALDLVTMVPRTVLDQVIGEAEWSGDSRWIHVDGQLVDRETAQVVGLPVHELGAGWVFAPDALRLGFANELVDLSGEVAALPVPDLGIDEVQGASSSFLWNDSLFTVYSGDSCDDCQDPGGRSTAVLFDFEAQTALVVPLELSYGVRSPDGTKVAFDTEEGTVATDFYDRSNPLRITPRRFVDFAPLSAAALFESDEDAQPTKPCYGYGTKDLYAVLNLQNLAADLDATELPGHAGLLLHGRAHDRNFDYFSLEFAPATTPEAWVPIGSASNVPVAHGALRVWVPPAADEYLVRLTVRDAAGNERSVIRHLSWSGGTALVNVTISEGLISPTGDGVKDFVKVSYLVAEPLHLEVAVRGPAAAGGAGPVVRRFTGDYVTGGHADFRDWDGHDTQGTVVPDGRYTIDLNGLELTVDVDSTPPEIAFEHGAPELISMSDLEHPGEFRVERRGYVVDPHLRQWTASWHTGPVAAPLYVPARDENGHVIYDGNTPRVSRQGGVPERVASGDSAVGTASVLPGEARAEDHAGNVSAVAVAPIDDAFRFVSIVAGLGGKRITHFPPEGTSPVPDVPPGDPTPLRLLPWSELAVASTRHGLATNSPAFEFHEPGQPTWTRVPKPAEGGAGPQGLSWRGDDPHPEWSWRGQGADAVVLGRLYEGRVTAEISGSTVATQPLFFRACEDYASLEIERDGADLRFRIGTDGLSEPVVSGEVKYKWGASSWTVPLAKASADMWQGKLTYPGEATCLKRATVSASLRTASGQVYRSDGACLDLDDSYPKGCSLGCRLEAPEQEFRYRLGNPDEGYLFSDVKNVGHPVLHFHAEHGPEADPTVDESGLPVLETTGCQPPFRPPDTCIVRATLDVAGDSDGQVDVRQLLTDPANSDQPCSGSFGVAVVDHTPPVVAVLSPAPGGRVCPGEGLVVRVDDDASPDVEIGAVEVRQGAGLYAPLDYECPVCTSPEPPALPHLSTGLPAVFKVDTSSLSEGEYTLRLTFYDRSGNRTWFEHAIRIGFGPPEVQVVGVEVPVFSPNADGQFDVARVRFATFEPAVLQGLVRQGLPDGPVVRHIDLGAGWLPPGERPLTWNGRNDGDELAPDGRYYLSLSAAVCAQGTSESGKVELDASPPALQISSPLPPPATVGPSVDVTGTASDVHFRDYTLEFESLLAPGSWNQIATSTAPVTAGLLGHWTAPEGDYHLRLRASDTVANARTSEPVLVRFGPRRLLESYAINPLVISPTGGSAHDHLTLNYVLLQDADVSIDILNGQGTVLHSVISEPQTAGPHSQVWTGEGAEEGELFARITAIDGGGGGGPETLQAQFAYDSTPPAISIAQPAPGAVTPGPVRGTIQDVRLESYVVTATPAQGAAIEIGSGTQNQLDADLGSLAQLAEGPYSLSVLARDAAGNDASVTREMIVDRHAPTVALHVPVDGTVLRAQAGPFDVRGWVEDANPSSWTLSFGAGQIPAAYTQIATGTSVGPDLALAAWDVSQLPQGLYTLKLEASDRGGLVALTHNKVTLDNEQPRAEFSAPAENALISQPFQVRGWASDAHLKTWRLELSPGEPPSAYQWSTVVTRSTAVENGLLHDVAALPPDGPWTFRLSVEDLAGLTATDLLGVRFDTTPPAKPTGFKAELRAAAGGLVDVLLSWNANGEPDLAAYRLRRADSEDDLPLANPLATAAVDAGLEPGTHAYVLSALDEAGNVSAPAQAQAIFRPPLSVILAPTPGAVVAGTVQVKGTASAPTQFREYRLSVGAGPDPAAFTLLRRSMVAVVAGVLGDWTPAQAGVHTLKLEVEDGLGNSAETLATVEVDLEPPVAPQLESVVRPTAPPNPDALALTWIPSTSTDSIGTLAYRNGRLANAPGVVVGDLRPYLIPGSGYLDDGLPDGEHCYRLKAMDSAGNLSGLSNELCETVENRTPQALIVLPADGFRFDHTISVYAETPDLDVVSVQFQISPHAAGTWSALNGPDAVLPYETALDPEALSLSIGDYDLRAVATDTGGNVDPNPATITVAYGDATPPATPLGLAAVVDGDTVTLNWEPGNSEAGVAYHVDRDGQRLTATPIDPPYDDVGVALGSHAYAVVAVDTSDNESNPATVQARVYQPTLQPPPFPVTQTASIDLAGSGASANGTVSLLREGAPVAASSADASGAFAFDDAPLTVGPALLSARDQDGAGNLSLPSADVVAIANEPPPGVSGLAGAVTDHDVALSWDAVAAPELHGYLVWRDGSLVTGSVPQTEGVAEATSSQTGHLPASAFDGNLATSWIPLFDTDSWWVTFPNPVLVEGLRLQFNNVPEEGVARYRVEAAWEGRFVPIVSVVGGNNFDVQHTLPTPFATDVLRIKIEEPWFAGLAEVSVTKVDVVPAGTTTYADAAVPDGVHAYRVTAVDRYGAVGDGDEESVPVGDVVPPTAPTGLVATVADSDVVLTWNPNVEADLDHYLVVRDGGEGGIGTSSAPTYLDAGLPNGTYTYTVRAVDAAGNTSADSNPASAVVDVQPLAAPVLAGSAQSDGSAWLTWQHPGAAGFSIERADTAGGPYAALAQVGSLRSYRDRGLSAGAQYFYVVVALDAVGNPSAPSNEVALVAVHVPATPAIFQPTDADRPVTVSGIRTNVAGRAEAGMIVELRRAGVVTGSVVASADEPGFALNESLPISGLGLKLAASPSGRYVADPRDEDDGLRLSDLSDSSSTTWGEAGRQRLASPSFSPDSATLAYAAFSEDAGGQVLGSGLYVRGLPAGSAVLVADYVGSIEVGESAFAPDGQSLAFVLKDGTDKLMLVNLAGGAPDQLLDGAGRKLRHPRFAPDGGHVAVSAQDAGGGPAELLLVDLAGGTATLTSDADAGDAPSFAPDGTRIAYTLASHPAIELLTFASGARDAIEPGFVLQQPRFSPDGLRLAYRATTTYGAGQQAHLVRVQTLSGGTSVDSLPWPLPAEPTLLEWPEDDRLLLARAGAVDRLTELTGTFEFPDQPLQPGENVFTAQATDSAGSGPESRPISVTALDIGFPNLNVESSDLLVYPGVPQVGQTARFSAVVHNTGGGVGPFMLRLRIRAADGQTLAESQPSVPWLDPGQATAQWLDWAPTAAGSLTFEAWLDPDDAVLESNETDNRAERTVQTVPANTLQLQLFSDRGSYAAQSPVVLVASALNGGPAFSGSLQTVVEALDGTLVATIDVRQVQLAYGQGLDQLLAWNTAATFAGDYRFVSRLIDAGQQVRAEAWRDVTILPSAGASAQLVADALVVPLGQPAGFAARIENTGLNVPLAGLTARLEIYDSTDTVIYSSDTPLPLLLPGSHWTGALQWPVAAPAGNYEADLVVLQQNVTLALHGVNFSVEATPGQVIGQIVVTPADVQRGLPVSAAVTITNTSTAPIDGYPWALEIVHGAGATVAVRLAFNSDLPAQGEFTTSVALSTDGLPYGPVIVRLRGGAPEATLARADLRLHAPIERPSPNSPPGGAVVGSAQPLLVVNNATSAAGAALSYEFEVFDREELGFPVATAAGVPGGADPDPGTTAWRVSPALIDDLVYYWRARAGDGFSLSPWSDVAEFRVDAHNEPPPAPRPDTPLPGEHVASLSPSLTVANPLDPDGDTLTYDFRVASDPQITQVVASVAGHPEGPGGLTSWSLAATLVEDARYYWQARADDGRGGSPWSDPIDFLVDTANASPGPPVLLHPAPAGRVASLSVTLSVGPALDPEHDPLVYRFEIDKLASFDSPDKQVSPSLPEGLGDTSWVPPVPLEENTRYYWRAAAHDGHTSGPWAVADFFVSSVNEAPGSCVLLDPVDGQVVQSATPTLTLRNAVDPDEDGLTYRFLVRDQGGATVLDEPGVIPGLLETSLNLVDPLAEDAVFEWSAQAEDGALTGPLASFESFRVNAQPQAPTAPSQVAPSEGAVLHLVRPLHVVGNATSPDGYTLLKYRFELYSVDAGGGLTLVDSAPDVAEGPSQTSWTPSLDLAEGDYSWRVRAADPERDGPWMSSGHYRVALPPLAPNGLEATAGDEQVELSWTASPDASVIGYRVYRATQTGGPYQLVGQPTAPTYLDTGLANAVPVFYVVTAVDDLSLESLPSAEASATPQSTVLTAEVAFEPAALSGECALCSFAGLGDVNGAAGLTAAERRPAVRMPGEVQPRVECVADNEDGSWTALFGYENAAAQALDVPIGPDNFVTPGPLDAGQPVSFAPGRSRFPEDAFHVEFHAGDVLWSLLGERRRINSESRRCTREAPATICPEFVYLTIELPAGTAAGDIELASVRLQGTLPPDPTFSEIVDSDGDGLLELRVRFPRAGLLPLLVPGPNALALTGTVGPRSFAGSATLTLGQPSVNLRFLELGNVEEHKLVVAILAVPACLGAGALDPSSLYLNGSVVPLRITPLSGDRLRLVFLRREVLASLPPGGPRVPVTLTGLLAGQPFSVTEPFLVYLPALRKPAQGGVR